MSQER